MCMFIMYAACLLNYTMIYMRLFFVMYVEVTCNNHINIKDYQKNNQLYGMIL